MFTDAQGSDIPTSFDGLHEYLRDTQELSWLIGPYKTKVEPGHLVLVRCGGKHRVGGAALLRVTRVDAPKGSEGRLFMVNVPEISDRLRERPLPDPWLLSTLNLPTYRGRVHPIVHAYPAIRAELLGEDSSSGGDGRPESDRLAELHVRKFDPDREVSAPRASDPLDPIARADALGKAVKGHQALLVALHRHLRRAGIRANDLEEAPRAFDLRVGSTIFEVKTTTPANHHDQVRMGLAQLLDYRIMCGPPQAELCLALDQPLLSRQRRLLDSVGVACVWFDGETWRLQTDSAGTTVRELVKKRSGKELLSARRKARSGLQR